MMDLGKVAIGEWPNIAIVPGTDMHAASGERVRRPSDHGTYLASRAGCEDDGLHDSAERLAADIMELSHSVALTNDGDFQQVESYVTVPVSKVREWLDRAVKLAREGLEDDSEG